MEITQEPIYMWSPNEPAKLFSRFIYAHDINIDGANIEAQLANFINHKKLRWIFEEKTEKGIYKIDGRLLNNAVNFRIRTNFTEEINQFDIVWLKHPLFYKGKYFIIKEQVDVEIHNYPKPLILFQHLLLETLSFDTPNIQKLIEEINNAKNSADS